MGDVEQFLAGLDDAQLAAVLQARPDATGSPRPRTLGELADRIDSPQGVIDTLLRLPLPCTQLAEAVVAVGSGTTVEQFGQRIGHDLGGPPGRWLQVLREHALVWVDGDGRLACARAVRSVFPSPLGLGPSLAAVFAEQSVDRLRPALRGLGLDRPPTRRAEVVATLIEHLSSPAVVRARADRAPEAVRARLTEWALQSSTPQPDDELVWAGPEEYRARHETSRWAVENGLAWQVGWATLATMPAEVALALRGTQLNVPFDHEPPPLRPDHGAPTPFAAAVSEIAQLALAVLDAAAQAPLPALKSGGLGVRELGRLQAATRSDARAVRLVLELLAGAGVLVCVDGGWRPSDAGVRWRASEPADRTLALLQAWLAHPGVPSLQLDDDGKAVPALRPRACAGCSAARDAVLQVLRELPPDTHVGSGPLAAYTAWARPYVHARPEPGEARFARVLDEAARLGVALDCALTELGRALVDDRPDRVRELLAGALPATSTQALFGADLTAVVAGAPAAALSALLDLTADRESSGGATVWRFSPGSVRRALDAGHDATQLLADLDAAAGGRLPQALHYLVQDLAARHGAVRVAPATTVLRSDDVALLAQIAAERGLGKLGLRLLAPTVLSAQADTDTVLTALRRAGYLPMPETAARPAPAGPGAAGPDRTVPRPGAPRRTRREQPAADELVHDLRTARSDIGRSETERQLAGAAVHISKFERRVLAQAIDGLEPVVIDYESSAGVRTRRTITEIDLQGDSLLAWCELRSDERWFRLDRIVGVLSAG